MKAIDPNLEIFAGCLVVAELDTPPSGPDLKTVADKPQTARPSDHSAERTNTKYRLPNQIVSARKHLQTFRETKIGPTLSLA